MRKKNPLFAGFMESNRYSRNLVIAKNCLNTKMISELILVEPYLKTVANHHLTYALDIARAAEKRGIKTRIVADRDIEEPVRCLLEDNRIESIPIFPTRLLTITKSRFLNWPLMSLAYACIVLALIRKSHNHTAICTLSGNIEYLTVISAVLSLLQIKTPLVIQLYVWERGEYRSFMPKLIKFYRLLTEKVTRKPILQKKLILAGQGRQVANHIRKRLGVEVPQFPFIIDWGQFPRVRLGEPPYRIAFLGVMRAEKGLQQLIDSISFIKSQIEFYIQTYVPPTLYERSAHLLIKKIGRLKNCHHIDGEISIDEYREIISQVDIIVLPYRPQDFNHKTSNVLTEAIGLGKVVIAPVETSLGIKLRELNVGVTYSPYTPEKLAAAVDYSVAHYETLCDAVKKITCGWKCQHSSDAFLDRLIEVMQ